MKCFIALVAIFVATSADIYQALDDLYEDSIGYIPKNSYGYDGYNKDEYGQLEYKKAKYMKDYGVKSYGNHGDSYRYPDKSYDHGNSYDHKDNSDNDVYGNEVTYGNYDKTRGSYRPHLQDYTETKRYRHCNNYDYGSYMHKACYVCSSKGDYFSCPRYPRYKPTKASASHTKYGAAPRSHFKHTDPSCYWQCDGSGNAFAKPCPKGLKFSKLAQVCV